MPKSPPKRRRPKKPQTEAEFLAGYDASAYERPSLTVDVALLSVVDDALATLLVRRTEHPWDGAAALPGGFVRMDESIEEAAERVLLTKAGLRDVFLEQLYTFGAVERDPRTRVVTVAHYALVDAKRFEAIDQEEHPALTARLSVPWEGETGGPVDVSIDGEPAELAFDHADILGMAVKRIRGKLDYTPIGFQLLPPRFTLRQLQRVHEVVLDRPLNKDSFRRRMLASGQLEATGERQRDVDHRPAALYRFVRRSAV
ncbi:MAG: NUDIX domain-containing protein [Sandaracinaceae bacterium]